MEEEKNTPAAVDWDAEPNPKRRKRTRKKKAAEPKPPEAPEVTEAPAAPADTPAESAPEAAPADIPAEVDPEPTPEDTVTKPEPTPEDVGRDDPIPPQQPDAAAPESPEEEPAPEAPAEEVPEAPAEEVPDAPTEEPAAPEAPAEEPQADDTPEPDPEDTPEGKARAATISRTAQLSIAKIMEQLDEDAANTPDDSTAPDPTPAASSANDDTDTAEDDEPEDTIPQKLGRAGFGMVKWLLLVVLFVLIIAGAGVAWLYRSATPDMLPEIKATFDGQTLTPTAYSWHVPVVGNLFKRTYAETISSTPAVLETPVSGASPDLIVTPSGYNGTLTITDADKNTVYEGGVTGFRSYLFTENGTFDAKLVVKADSTASDTGVTGSETWQFQFTVSIKPSFVLSTPSVQQGSVAAVRVGPTLGSDAPAIKTTLENTGFVKASNGWICYLPIPWNAEPGNVTVSVTADGYTEELTLAVRAASYTYKDYSRTSQMTSPYIGENDAPTAVAKLLAASDDGIAWATGGFVQPFLDSFDTPLLYGMTEYAGRSYSERGTNYGYGGRTSTNVVVKLRRSSNSLIVPASGRVLLAEDLGGDYGYTVVIDHGAGLKSIFYGLTALEVKQGESVKQGQLLGSCGRTAVAEMRIGTVPINPLLVWRGQCDGLKNY